MALHDLPDTVRMQLEYKAFVEYISFLLTEYFPQKERYDLKTVKEDLVKSINDFNIEL